MSTDAMTAVLPTAAASLTQPTAGSLPAGYLENDPVQRSQARIAHILGLFGILGTGIFYLAKKNDAGAFVRDQMKEAFNFHLLVFALSIGLSIVGAVLAAIVGVLGLLVSLASTLLLIVALILSILNGLKAGKGEVARYPARLSVLK